ncbi:MAG: hypothetical protein JST80_11970 [Bdellovibrionales bacterium]|nr:hypothetical protein [Bdellovibrionales bacterium]
MKAFYSLLSVVALVSAFAFLQSCARSDQFKKDQEFYEETPEGYYTQQYKSPGEMSGIEKIKQPKKKVLVLNFWNDTPTGDDALGAYSAEELRREMFLSKRVLLPRTDAITTVTKDFVDGDHVNTTQLVREGRKFGVSSIIVGRISKITIRQDREEVGILREAQNAVAVDVEMKVFDVISGREVHSAKRTGYAQNTAKIAFNEDAVNGREAREEIAKDALHDAMMKLVPEALVSMDKMDWQGRVAKILGNKVYLNAGRQSGLLSGDILKVMSPGEEIVDPVTKSYLGRSEGFLKGTLEVTEFIGEDSALTLIHTGGNFQEGDVVRLY